MASGRHLRRSLAIAAATVALAGPALAQPTGAYVRATIGLDWSLPSAFFDRDCNAPDNFFGCNNGEGGLPTGARGDFGNAPLVELGVGFEPFPAIRLEATVARRLGLAFAGNANFINSGPIQPAGGGLGQFTAMGFVYVDLLKALAIDSPVEPFLGLGLGVARNAIDPMLYEFPFFVGPYDSYRITPGGVHWSAAWSLVAGLGLKVSERVTLDLAYRHNRLGKVVTDPGPLTIQYSSGNPPPDISIGETWAPLATHGASLSLRFAL